MKEVLTQLFGDAVTEEAMKTFNSELGKKFVAKADFNAKNDEVKALKGEKKTLEDEIAKLNDTAKGGSCWISKVNKNRITKLLIA